MPTTHGTFTGSTPIALAPSGLPAGVSFVDNGNGTYTLTGSYPPAGTYPYGVVATNAAGASTLSGNTLVSTAAVNPITQFPFGMPNAVRCAVADSPNSAQYALRFQPNGIIRVGTSTTPVQNTGDTWYAGAINPADYEIFLASSFPVAVSSSPSGVWLNLGSQLTFVWDRNAPSDDCVDQGYTIRDVATQTVRSIIAHQNQVGVDVLCLAC